MEDIFQQNDIEDTAIFNNIGLNSGRYGHEAMGTKIHVTSMKVEISSH